MSDITTPVKKKMSRKMKLVAFLALGFGLFGIAGASAVSLGVSATNQLGAGTSVTATCQPSGASNDIGVAFASPTYAPATKKFTVGTVNLSNIAAACNTKSYQVVVADSTGAVLSTATGTVSGTSAAVALGTAVDSSLVASVSLVIYN